MILLIEGGFKIRIDPTRYWVKKNGTTSDILHKYELVPTWITNGDPKKSMVDNARATPGCVLIPIEGAVTNDKGVHQHAGKPDRYPLLSITDIKRNKFYQYESGVMAFIEVDQPQFHSRMISS